MKLSIVTVNLNNAEGLKKTAESISVQSCRDFEWIVIDGGSKDGSVEVLADFQDIITFMVSEKDTGIYNAMNKGVRNAKGEYLLFLNSGDCLAGNDVIGKVLHNGLDADIVYGDSYNILNGEIVKKETFDDKLSFYFLKRFSLQHQSSFIRRSLLIDRPYDEKYRIVSDKKFFLEMALYGKTFRHIPIIVSLYDISGISSINMSQVMEEENRLMKEAVPQCIANDYSEGRIGTLISLRKRHRLFGKCITFLIVLMEKIDSLLN